VIIVPCKLAHLPNSNGNDTITMIFLSSFPRSGNTFLRNILFEVYGLKSGEFNLDSTHPLNDDFRTFSVLKTHELPSSLKKNDADIPTVYLVRDGRDSVC